jgi:putative ABC transport system permease protein
VLAFALGTTLLTSIVFGLVPALAAARTEPGSGLARARVAGGRGRLGTACVVGQVALSLVLLIGGALFLRALTRARSLDPGFAPDQVQVTSLNLSIVGRNEAQGRALYRELVRRVSGVPGVTAVSLAHRLPLSLGVLTEEVRRGGDPVERSVRADWNIVAPGYFETLGVPLVAGRSFANTDAEGQPRVAIVNRALAQRLWPNDDALGQRVATDSDPMRVVGVVQNFTSHRLGEAPRPQLYVPWEQRYNPGMSLLVRNERGQALMAAGLRSQIHALDHDLPILMEIPLRDYMERVLAPQRLAAAFAGGLGALGLVLAVVGLYGVLAQFVAQRVREIGIRVALGAGPGSVLRLVLAEGMSFVAAGIVLGLAAAAALSRLTIGFLAGLSPADPLAFLGASLLLLVAGFWASYLPASRATRMRPTDALRSE